MVVIPVYMIYNYIALNTYTISVETICKNTNYGKILVTIDIRLVLTETVYSWADNTHTLYVRVERFYNILFSNDVDFRVPVSRQYYNVYLQWLRIFRFGWNTIYYNRVYWSINTQHLKKSYSEYLNNNIILCYVVLSKYFKHARKSITNVLLTINSQYTLFFPPRTYSVLPKS